MEKVLTTKEAAAALGISERAVRALLERGTLAGRKLGREWIIDPASVQAHLERKQAESKEDSTPG